MTLMVWVCLYSRTVMKDGKFMCMMIKDRKKTLNYQS